MKITETELQDQKGSLGLGQNVWTGGGGNVIGLVLCSEHELSSAVMGGQCEAHCAVQ